MSYGVKSISLPMNVDTKAEGVLTPPALANPKPAEDAKTPTTKYGNSTNASNEEVVASDTADTDAVLGKKRKNKKKKKKNNQDKENNPQNGDHNPLDDVRDALWNLYTYSVKSNGNGHNNNGHNNNGHNNNGQNNNGQNKNGQNTNGQNKNGAGDNGPAVATPPSEPRINRIERELQDLRDVVIANKDGSENAKEKDENTLQKDSVKYSHRQHVKNNSKPQQSNVQKDRIEKEIEDARQMLMNKNDGNKTAQESTAVLLKASSEDYTTRNDEINKKKIARGALAEKLNRPMAVHTATEHMNMMETELDNVRMALMSSNCPEDNKKWVRQIEVDSTFHQKRGEVNAERDTANAKMEYKSAGVASSVGMSFVGRRCDHVEDSEETCSDSDSEDE